MKILENYGEPRNQIRVMFKQKLLSLSNAQDRQQIADHIECALSPENLACDGELHRSAVDRKYRMLTCCAEQLLKLFAAVKFYEFS